VYPYLKRFTPLCHFGVGAALALAPLAGWAVARPDLGDPWAAVWLAMFAFWWVSGFDIIYATLDEEFDRRHGVHSMVVWLGGKRALAVSAWLHLFAFMSLLTAVRHIWWDPSRMFPPWAPWAFPALIVVILGTAVMLWLEQKWAEDVNLAFFKINVYVGFAVLAIVLLARVIDGGGFGEGPPAPWVH